MNIKLLILCYITPIFGLTQKMDEYEYNSSYYLVDHTKWSINEIIPDESNIALDTLTKVMYNPYMNLAILDSINSFRTKNYVLPIEYDYNIKFSKQFMTYMNYGIDISKIENSKVLIETIEEPEPECDCVNSIIEMLLDDSLEFEFRKKSYTLKDKLLDKNIRRINIDYYQVRRRDDPEEHEGHINVTIWRRYRLIPTTYPVL